MLANLTACNSRRREPCTTSGPRKAAHPDPADKDALRERMYRLENRGARVSRRSLMAEARCGTENGRPAGYR